LYSIVLQTQTLLFAGVDLRDEDLDALLDRSANYDQSAKAGVKNVRQNAKDFNIESAKSFTTYLFQGEVRL
jgi:hypothetical protein